jgi:hypothetical protein
MSPISFVTAGLAAGAALAAIPVIIHLVMRQTPKHVIFPALRLIKERQKRSRKRMRIRNWLLLAARMLLVALMALALARPRIAAKASLGDREVPSALAFVFDTSLSMEYKEKDKTRLREAQDRAAEVLGRTHESSQVFVIDSAEPGTPAAMSPAAARKRIEALALRPVNRRLNAAMGQAYNAVAASDLPRHEVYVLTDLARSAWDLGPGKTAEGLDAAKKVKEGVATYILRLSPRDLRDVAVVSAETAGDLATGDQPLTIKARLRSTGPAARRRVELRIDDAPRGNKEVAVPADGEVDVPPFVTPKLAPGLHQVEVRLGGEPDPLKFDDSRFLTLDVQPPLKVLVVADRSIDRLFVANALDPVNALGPGDPRPFRVTQLRPAELEKQPPDYLKDFACVFLLNASKLLDAEWGRLHRYVQEGGGLVVALGDLVDAANYNDTLASRLLPASVDPKVKRDDTSFGDGDWNHALFGRFRDRLQKSLSGVPVYRHAVVEPRKEGARVLLRFLDKDPALVERSFPGPRTGHVLLWATSLSRRTDLDPSKSPAYWTDFPNDWTFWEIVNQTVPYAAGLANRRLTYEAGDDVALPIEPGRRFTNFTVKGPESKAPDRLAEPATNATLTLVAPQQIGPWAVVASGAEGVSKTYGFSINPPLGEELLAPLAPADLDGLFGKKNYQLADDAESLKRSQTEARVGREIFPWIMALILALVTAENFLANRFYRERTAAAEAPGRPAGGVPAPAR